MPAILIVEDSSAMRAHLRSCLGELPEIGEIEITEAASGFEALRLMPRSRYDLVIADVNLPNIDGLELIRFIRQSAQNRGVGLIVISNRSSERDRERALAVGADVFLAKPFAPDILRGAIVRVLAGERRARRSDPGAHRL
ncbi:MAG: response regulator [Polyangiaceae bacterium]|nr:response regulator [Polyangiaceae bacterium]